MALANKIDTKNMLWSLDKLMAQINKPPKDVKTNFFRLLAVGQRVWLGLRESLKTIAMSESNKVMKTIIWDMIEQINQWVDLSVAMKQHLYFFGTTEIELVKAAQKMGNMPETLNEIALEAENFQQIVKKIKKALTYPITLLVVTVAAVSILMVKVIPTMVDMFPSEDALPQITKIVLHVSDFMINRWWILLTIVVGTIVWFIVLYKYFLPFKIGVDGLILKIPVVGDAVKMFYMYRFSKLLGDFMMTGVDQISAIDQMASIFSNFFYKKKMLDIKYDLNAWFSLSDTVEWSDLLDPILIQIISVGEKTGDLGSILRQMSEFYKEQLLWKIDAVMAFIEPILLAGMAVVIGAIVAAIFLPMASMLDNVENL